MKDESLKAAQLEIDEALKTVDAMEKDVECKNISKEAMKEHFSFLTSKLLGIENILKKEGIL